MGFARLPAWRCLLLATGLGALPTLRAQGPPALDDLSGRRRPRLAAEADTNDWQVYFDYGISQLREHPEQARLAFFWAQRLDPGRAEPLYGRWVAYWMGRPGWWEDYIKDKKSVVESPPVLRVDSLYTRALLRNPFVPQTMSILLYEQLPGTWGHDRLTQALIEYSAGKLTEAAHDLALAIRSDPRGSYTLHYDRALVLTGLQRWDSAAAEMELLLDELRRRDTTRITHTYQSRELLLYGLGLLKLIQGDRAGGRAALESALLENLSFFPAHTTLGQQAMLARDTGRGLREFSLALELSRGDSWTRFLYGQALTQAGRSHDAAAQLDSVIQAEPLFADPYLALGKAREAAGELDAARIAYEAYLRLAPRRALHPIAYARDRLAALPGRRP